MGSDVNSALGWQPFPAYPSPTPTATPYTPFPLASGGHWHSHARRPGRRRLRPCTSGRMPSWTEGVKRCVCRAACPRGGSLSPDSLQRDGVGGTLVEQASLPGTEMQRLGHVPMETLGPVFYTPLASHVSLIPAAMDSSADWITHGLLCVGLSLCSSGKALKGL